MQRTIGGSFPFVPPHVSGCVLFAPPDARAIFLHNDLLCNDTCNVTAGCITYWGHKRKRSLEVFQNLETDCVQNGYVTHKSIRNSG